MGEVIVLGTQTRLVDPDRRPLQNWLMSPEMTRYFRGLFMRRIQAIRDNPTLDQGLEAFVHGVLLVMEEDTPSGIGAQEAKSLLNQYRPGTGLLEYFDSMYRSVVRDVGNGQMP